MRPKAPHGWCRRHWWRNVVPSPDWSPQGDSDSSKFWWISEMWQQKKALICHGWFFFYVNLKLTSLGHWIGFNRSGVDGWVHLEHVSVGKWHEHTLSWNTNDASHFPSVATSKINKGTWYFVFLTSSSGHKNTHGSGHTWQLVPQISQQMKLICLVCGVKKKQRDKPLGCKGPSQCSQCCHWPTEQRDWPDAGKRQDNMLHWEERYCIVLSDTFQPRLMMAGVKSMRENSSWESEVVFTLLAPGCLSPFILCQTSYKCFILPLSTSKAVFFHSAPCPTLPAVTICLIGKMTRTNQHTGNQSKANHSDLIFGLQLWAKSQQKLSQGAWYAERVNGTGNPNPGLDSPNMVTATQPATNNQGCGADPAV